MERSGSRVLQRPILQTKLTLPRTRAQVVLRPRLLRQLDRAFAVERAQRPKLTLITGPAGYGKTTLAVQWVDSLARPVAWLALDKGDNDEARFVAYFIAAIARVLPNVTQRALERLSTSYLYDDTEAILTTLLNDLAAQDTAIVIVLDDYHAITAAGVHQAVSFILQHLPLQLHLVITSRGEPPLPIALLRARGSLSWADASDLRFNRLETAQFLAETMNVVLDERQLQRLETHVEGWVTGLQLVALALREQVDLATAFSGNQRYLVDYLGEQVLTRQPEAMQTFLLETAVLTHFNADLCHHVTGQDGAACLAAIEQANLFLIPLDAERQWYRYHHLFADFLYGRLRRRHPPEAIARLHRRAADWYETATQPHVAVEHALAAGDEATAVRLMTAAAPRLLMFGEGQTLRQWVEALSGERQRSTPALTLYYIWSLIRTGEFTQAADLLETVSAELESPSQWGEWSALRARLAVMTGDTEINIRFSQKALAKLPDDAHMLRSEVAINLGFSHLQSADLPAARLAFSEAARNRQHDPGLWAVMFATFYWGQTYEREGRLAEAYEIYERGLATAGVNGHHPSESEGPSPAVGFMHVGLGRILYEWNRLAEAETHLRQGLAFAGRSGDHKMLYYGREGLLHLSAAIEDWTAVEQLLTELEGENEPSSPSRLRAHLALRQGDPEPARKWVDRLNLRIDADAEHVRQWPYAYTTLIRLRLHERRYDGVLSLLQLLEELSTQRNNVPFLLAALLMQSLVAARQGMMETAVPLFRRTLLLARPGGYRRLFLDFQDGTLVRLLHLASANEIVGEAARSLLAEMEPAAVGSAAASFSTASPLTLREMEVLQQLAVGLTNREIAVRLVISPNTVKAHTRRLYEKLAVRSRTQAVVRGRELGLLDG